MVPLCLGFGIVGLLGVAASAASANGSPLSPGAPELSDLPSTVFLAAAATALVLYALALQLVRRRGAGLMAVCAVAAAIQLVPLAGPLVLSRDVYAYWAYGRLAEHHDSNPYSVPPARYAADPATLAMAGAWRNGHSVYGPAFSAVSAGLAATTGRSAETSALAYRLLAALGMLAAIGLVALNAPLPAFAAAFVGWNPLLALDFAGGGHNDVWMAVFVLGGVVLAGRRPAAAGASWAVAGGLKWTALALLPLTLLQAGRREARKIACGFNRGGCDRGGCLPPLRYRLALGAGAVRPSPRPLRSSGAPRRPRAAGLGGEPRRARATCGHPPHARPQRPGGAAAAGARRHPAAAGQSLGPALVRGMGRTARSR